MRGLLTFFSAVAVLAGVTFPPTASPTTAAPTLSPTSAQPTTQAPTKQPTTGSPSKAPTTVSPSHAPTTAAPHTAAPTAAAPTNSGGSSAASQAAGYVCAGLAVVFFGSNFIPVKRYAKETGDGMFFQWVMCTAIFIAGCLVQYYLEIENPDKQTVFEPIATLGGILWCTGNALSVPTIQMIGMGLGLLIWGAANLSAGWASSFFGILGQPKSPVPHSDLNIAGAMVCLSSLAFFFFVKSNDAPEERNVNTTDEEVEERLYQGTEDSDDRGFLLKKSSRGSWLENMSPGVKKPVGFCFAVVAGLFFGVNFNPPFYLIGPSDCTKLTSQNDCLNHAGKDRCMWNATLGCVENPHCIHSKDAIDYVFSHFTGIFLASTFYFLLYCCIKLFSGQQPQASPKIIVPGFLSGLGWAIAQISWFVANGALSPVVSFPIVTTGPGLVAAAWGVLLYKEIEGARNFMFLGAAFSVVVIGILLITFSKQD